MSGQGIMQNEKHGDTNALRPDWAKIWATLFISLIVFFISNWVFLDTLSDIRGYISDHNIEYANVEYYAILLFLISFYVIPIYLIDKYNKCFPNKKCKNIKILNISRVLSSALFVSAVLIFIFPRFAPMEGEERNALRWIVFYWLVSIFLINILFGEIQENLAETIKEIRFHKGILNLIKIKLIGGR